MIGDKEHPIRCSKLSFIVKCSARTFMLGYTTDDDEGPESAQTGSVVHAGIAAFHKEKGSLAIRKGAALDAIKNAAPLFPARRLK